MKNRNDLGSFLDNEVYPALFSRLDAAFPEFGFVRKSGHWEATDEDASRALPPSPRPDRVICYENRPWGLVIQGGPFVRFLDLVNGGRKPTGPEFVPAVRKLSELAGVAFPEREVSPEEAARMSAQEDRRTVLEAVTEHAQGNLWSEDCDAARAYLEERGLSGENVQELGIGYYLAAVSARSYLEGRELDLKAAEDAGLLWEKLEGYVLFPWADATGRPLTLYGRWAGNTPPDGHPKTLALRGEGTKSSPLYFDRARKAGHRDLVAVEGVIDAALAQARGDSRVVAYVAAQFSAAQVETLSRYKVRSVTVCPDPDSGGDKGVLSSVDALTKAGIAAYVAPRLPEGLDPDEFILRNGIEAWREFVGRAVPGTVFRAKGMIGNVTAESPDMDRRRVVEEVLRYEAGLHGPRAGLDREDILRLLEERTGYTAGTLLELAEDFTSKRRKEDAEKALQAALREAQEDAGKRPAVEVAKNLLSALSALEARTVDAPPPFSVDRIRDALGRKPGGKPSGWTALDELEVRFHAGELSTLVGRPGHGKTSALVGLLLNWLQAAEKAGTDELFVLYSFEEPEEFLAARLVSLLTTKGDPWTSSQVRAFLRDRDDLPPTSTWPNPKYLNEAWATLRALEGRLQIVFRPGWTVDDMVAHARELAARENVGGILVDYWQKIPPPGGKSMSGEEARRDIALAVVGRRLKALAVDLACPVVAGAQAGRNTEKEANRIPAGASYEAENVQKALRSRRFSMQDIREGGIEQEADLALGLLNFRADFREGSENYGTIPDVTRLEIGVLKNRYGPPGKWVGLAFEGRFHLLRDPRGGEEL